jgi:isomerase DpgB
VVNVELHIDGSTPLTKASVAAVEDACAAVEAGQAPTMLVVYVTGTANPGWTHGLDVAVVSKWERSLRRLERLGVLTVAVASGDCGGPALDGLLATDHRIATPDLRLALSVDGDALWPGMAIFRLSQQGGGARLRRMILSGGQIDAYQGVELGLVDEVTDDLDKALQAVAELVSPLSGPELAIRRQLMCDAATTSFEDALGRHLAACDRVLRRSAARGVA